MFTVPADQIAAMRTSAAEAFHGYASFYELTVTRDVYGNETYNSGLINTYPCYFGGITGDDEEIVTRLVTDGKIKSKIGKCLLPWNAALSDDYVVVISGVAGDWNIAWDNQDTLPQFRLYTKAILTSDTKNTTYKDHIKRNG